MLKRNLFPIIICYLICNISLLRNQLLNSASALLNDIGVEPCYEKTYWIGINLVFAGLTIILQKRYVKSVYLVIIYYVVIIFLLYFLQRIFMRRNMSAPQTYKISYALWAVGCTIGYCIHYVVTIILIWTYRVNKLICRTHQWVPCNFQSRYKMF